MHSALIGCCLLTMVNFSVSLHVFQKPRFLGVKSHRPVPLYCAMPDEHSHAVAEWFKAEAHDEDPKKLVITDKIEISANGNVQNGRVKLPNPQPDDSGVYYCKLNDTMGPGTQLQVFRKINAKRAEHRGQLKDALIIILALLLVTLVTFLVVRLKHARNNEDIIYEEPEDNHIYEGLGIEHCGLYEDIPAYSENSEAPWGKDNSPCEE
ncbi:hypothetical protein GJAV_G00151300 [Gymnothorax javanicus]|nr:hypothetical protein GJAV_G00151300 [Gymnothorax javanicus]